MESPHTHLWLEEFARDWRNGLEQYLEEFGIRHSKSWWSDQKFMSVLYMKPLESEEDSSTYFPDGKDVTLQCIEDWLGLDEADLVDEEAYLD